MKSAQAPIATARRRASNWSIYSLVPKAAFLFLFFLFVVLALHQWGAHRQANVELNRIKDAGYPYDNASLAEWFRNRSSDEMTVHWNEILVALSSMRGTDLPFVGSGEFPNDLRPGMKWKQEPQVAAYLQEMQPVLTQIQQVARSKSLVWMPVNFSGFGTLLSHLLSSLQVTRCLRLEFEHALYHQDASRAMRAIELMDGTARAFHWDFSLNCALVAAAHTGVRDLAIGRSLDTAIWTDAQLSMLVEYFRQPPDHANIWNQFIIAERGSVMSSWNDLSQLPSPEFWVLRLPSVRLALLSDCRLFEDPRESDLAKLVARVQGLEASLAANSRPSTFQFNHLVSNIFLPAFSACARSLEIREQTRRLSLTGLSVKRFQLKHQRWPESVGELESLGLVEDQWSTLRHGPFQYKIDGNRVFLWGVDTDGQRRSFDDVLELASADDSEQSWYLRIR